MARLLSPLTLNTEQRDLLKTISRCREVPMGSRAEFLQDTRQRILAFIEFFNETLAKPSLWIYIGKPLLV